MPVGVGQQQGVEAILGAARRENMTREQTAALLATGYVESGWNPGAVGDNGTSFGLFQQHAGGAGGPTVATARRYTTPTLSASEAAARFKAAGVASGAGAAASQRPADQAGYAKKVDAVMRQILAGTFGPLNRALGGSTTTKPKWSPLRDATRAKARELGLRHTSGDRTPDRNAAAGGVGNSNHLSTKTDAWADDYVGSEAAMAQLVAWARANGAIEAMVHDAGSGRHAHIAGRATGGVDIGGSSAGSSSSGANGDLQTVGWKEELGDDIARTAIKAVVVLAGLALAAGLIFAGVTRITGTERLAGAMVRGGK